MKSIIVILALMLSSCAITSMVDDDEKRARLMALPEVREIIAARDLDTEGAKTKWCALDPALRLIIRIEVEPLLLARGIKLPLSCSVNLS